MALTYTTDGENAIIDGWNAQCANGTLELRESDETVVATIALGATPWAAAAAGAAALTAEVEDLAADASGTVAKFVIFDSGANALVSGSVTPTGGGGDLTGPSLVITVNDVVTILTLPATV